MNNNKKLELYIYKRLDEYGHKPSMKAIGTDKDVTRNPDAYTAYSSVRSAIRLKYNLLHPKCRLGSKSAYTDRQLEELASYVDMLFPKLEENDTQ